MSLVSLLAVAALIAVLVVAMRGAFEQIQEAFAAYFRGVRSDPWPRGVQEEDRDRPWGAGSGGGSGIMARPPGDREPLAIAQLEELPGAPTDVATAPLRRRRR